jgi:GTP cyclohydrolase FolE2
MKNQLVIVSATCLLFAASACTCPRAAKTAHLGEETKTTKVSDGIDVTTHEKRSLLPTGKIAGEEITLRTARALCRTSTRQPAP